jgi:predicted ATP-grasp superfamily ATP-dependent carboligase
MAIRVNKNGPTDFAVNKTFRRTDVIIAGLRLNASADLRRLSSRGYHVLGITHDVTERGCHSRHGEKIVCPSPRENLEEWITFMERLGQACRRRPVLVATTECYVLALDRAAKRLNRYFRFSGFGSGLKTALTSKQRTFELAARHGLSVPKTVPVHCMEDLQEAASVMLFPAVVRPEFSHTWCTPEAEALLGNAKVLAAHNADDAAKLYERIRGVSPSVVLQEMIPGPDTNLIYWSGFVGPDHTVRGRFVGRTTRVTPANFGSATFVQLIDMREIEDMCEEFLKTIGYAGRCSIELKIDERDGTLKLLSVNPRMGQWEDIGIPAGVDLAREEVRSLFGGDPPVRRVNGSRTKWVHLGRDLEAFMQYRAEGSLGVMPWVKSLKPPIVVSDMPFISDFPYAWANARTIVGGLRSLMRRRTRKPS